MARNKKLITTYDSVDGEPRQDELHGFISDEQLLRTAREVHLRYTRLWMQRLAAEFEVLDKRRVEDLPTTVTADGLDTYPYRETFSCQGQALLCLLPLPGRVADIHSDILRGTRRKPVVHSIRTARGQALRAQNPFDADRAADTFLRAQAARRQAAR